MSDLPRFIRSITCDHELRVTFSFPVEMCDAIKNDNIAKMNRLVIKSGCDLVDALNINVRTFEDGLIDFMRYFREIEFLLLNGTDKMAYTFLGGLAPGLYNILVLMSSFKEFREIRETVKTFQKVFEVLRRSLERKFESVRNMEPWPEM